MILIFIILIDIYVYIYIYIHIYIYIYIYYNHIFIYSYNNLSSGASTLIDVFTDAHLSCIESFKDGIGSPSSLRLDNFAVDDDQSKTSSFDSYNEEDIDEMIYPQSVNEEMIVYQFAGLTKKVYEKIGKGIKLILTSNIYTKDYLS